MSNGVDFRRRGVVAAALGAGGVLAVLLAQDVVGAILSLLGSAPYLDAVGGSLGTVLTGAWVDSLTTTLPFSVGVFLSFWQLAPIGAVLRLAHVVTRSLLAAGVGSVAVLVVGIVVNLVNGVTTFVGRDFTLAPDDGGDLMRSVGYALQSAAATFVDVLPLVVLASVLLWLWIRGRDREVPLAGMIDL